MTDEQKLESLLKAKGLGERALETDDLEEMRALATQMLRYLWETDDDPDKQPWPEDEPAEVPPHDLGGEG